VGSLQLCYSAPRRARLRPDPSCRAPIIFATTKLVSPAWSIQDANVLRRSFGLTRGIPARRHAAARSLRHDVASGTFRDAGLSWKARTEGEASRTTPEELLAAAHASCFSMALSHGLEQGGHAPRRIETSCVVEFGPRREGGFEVRSSTLEVKGWVPGIDQAAFEKAAEDAKNGCPISSALKIRMSVTAALQP
jgi:lipoyl-dependent peroxiredoxin